MSWRDFAAMRPAPDMQDAVCIRHVVHGIRSFLELANSGKCLLDSLKGNQNGPIRLR